MLTKDKVISILTTDKQILKKLHLVRIGLFGSVARGTQNENSDLDFLVEFENGYKTWKNFNLICDYIEEKFGENYDLVTKDSLTQTLYERILKDIKYVQVNH